MSFKKLFVLLLLAALCSAAPAQENLQKVEQVQDKTGNDPKQPGEYSPHFEGNVTLGYQLGEGSFGLNRLKLDLSGSYLFIPQISLGVGIGARQYPDLKATMLPVYADFRACPLNTRLSPFFSLQIGTTFHMSKEFENIGMFVSPNLGISSRFADGTSMNFSIGYEYQRITFYTQGFGSLYEFTKNCGAVSFNLGFSF